MRKRAIIVSACLLSLGFAAAAIAQAPASSTGKTTLQQRIVQVRKQVRQQKDKVTRLHEQVAKLQKQNDSDRKHAARQDRRIARLQRQLKQLQQHGTDDPATSKPR